MAQAHAAVRRTVARACSGSTASATGDSEASVVDGTFWHDGFAWCRDDCTPISERADASAIRGTRCPFISCAGRAAERRFRNVDGGACTCGGLAYTPRRSSIDYECVMRVAAESGRERPHVLTGGFSGRIAPL